MTVAPKAPRSLPQAAPVVALVMDQFYHGKASVEIETMARGIPKVKVRVNDDDPQAALELALSLYFAAVERLEAQAIDTATSPEKGEAQ